MLPSAEDPPWQGIDFLERRIRAECPGVAGERGRCRCGGVRSQRLAGGGGGIRTPGTREGPAVFKTAAIDRSATPPAARSLLGSADGAARRDSLEAAEERTQRSRHGDRAVGVLAVLE